MFKIVLMIVGSSDIAKAENNLYRLKKGNICKIVK